MRVLVALTTALAGSLCLLAPVGFDAAADEPAASAPIGMAGAAARAEPILDVSPDTVLTFFAGLPRDSRKLRNAAKEISTPGSGRYREILSLRDAGRRYAGSDEAVAELQRVGQRLGITVRVDPTRILARLSAPVSTWERVMGQQVIAIPAQEGSAARGTSPFVSYFFFDQQARLFSAAPPALAGVVSEFFPGYQRYVASKDIPGPAPAVNNAARERARDMAPRSIWQPDPQPWPTNTGSPLGPACSANAVTQREVLTPSQIRGAYGIETLDRRGYRGSTARVAIISPNGGFSPADLSAFADCFDLPRQKVDVALGTGVGTPFVSWAVEASLDLQVVAGALAGRGEARIVQTINDIFLLGYIDGFTRALADPAGPPDAASVSYYWCEENYVQRVQVGQRGRMTPMFPVLEDVFAMAGIVGTSLLVASGDAGSGTCQLFGESSLPQPTAAYPASSPFMTAVGGTRLVLGPGNRRVSEVVWNDSPFNQPLASSGGLSNLFTAPWYQRGGLVWQQRAFPDIAALASTQPAYPVFVNGVLSSIGGTSGAAPLMAASFARISAFERSRGRPPIGFVNPWLYSLPKSTFLDITQGDNQLKFTLEGGAFNTPACCAATPGYDLATGHGVLKLPQAVALLPPPEGR